MSKSEPLEAEVVIYTDGGAQQVARSSGPGGWGTIMLFEAEGKRHERELSGSAEDTTNNRMEITAMLEGLKVLKRPCHVIVYTDSQYLQNSVGNWFDGNPIKSIGWMINWKRLGWRRKDGVLLNDDLWREMWELVKVPKSIRMKWIRGHNGNYYNERCDELATKAQRNWRRIND